MLREDPVDQGTVRDVALVERAAFGELQSAPDEVVEDHGRDARVQTSRGDGAADVAGSPGDKDGCHDDLFPVVYASVGSRRPG